MSKNHKRCYRCLTHSGMVVSIYTGNMIPCPECQPPDAIARIRAQARRMQELGMAPAGQSIVNPDGTYSGEQS